MPVALPQADRHLAKSVAKSRWLRHRDVYRLHFKDFKEATGSEILGATALKRAR